ncbi:MAG: hypothetical protein A3K19_09310 [Lentisphaerae bacterium RIFOXYB12_FULL_65_16]|nr:MAG: hypothetical protein A3K18_24510 [Lentisphaerae bacterium RIFOXYA12_64_32]OGV90448.1 MAG: hypothetical protein A3K19_09310 [Lentisphaerae bacterium RIFOXYB12_FULL_65_16]
MAVALFTVAIAATVMLCCRFLARQGTASPEPAATARVVRPGPPPAPAATAVTPATSPPRAAPARPRRRPTAPRPAPAPKCDALLHPALPPAESLSDDIRLILGLTQGAGYDERIRAAHRLGKELGVDELQALYWFLLRKDAGAAGSLEHNALRNDVLAALLKQAAGPPYGLGELMLAIYRDSDQDPVWRGYVVQYFAPFYEAQWPGARQDPEPGAELRAAMEAACWDAVDSPRSCVAGAALIGVERLSRRYPDMQRDRIGTAALSLAANPDTSIQTRVTAIQICGATGNVAALPAAVAVAQDSGVSLPLRLAAIAAIGALGAQEHRSILTAFTAPDAEGQGTPAAPSAAGRAGTDNGRELLRNAAGAALRRIEERAHE